MKHLLSILSVLCAFTAVMAIMAPRNATPRKNLYVAMVRWMIFIEFVLSGGYCGFLTGGIIGTIIGLIQAFTAVANANPADKADLLSASISVAMNTTAFGLIVAIPLLLIYAVLQTKTTELVDSMEMATVKFLNFITEHHKPGA